MKYRNPLLPGADPFVLKHERKYYLYPTLNENGIEVFESDDGVNFADKGLALNKDDTYGDHGFWAPEILYRNGIFFMVFVANEHLGIATSDSPLGPFRQMKKKPLDEDHMIDGHFLEGYDGNTYLYYVRFDHGNVIAVAKLNDDLLSLDLSTEKIVLKAEEPWEKVMENVAEGPFVLKHGGKYYLTYSCNHFKSEDYAVGYAVSDSPYGPFVKSKSNPILHGKGPIKGTGHHSFLLDDDGVIRIYYHCHGPNGDYNHRQVCVDKAHFEGDELIVDGPNETAEF